MEEFVREGMRRGRVQDDTRPRETRGSRRRHDRGHRIFELEQHQRRVLEVLRGSFHVLGRETPVRARHDDDGVLAAVGHENERDAAGAVGNRQHATHVAAHPLEIGPHPPAIIVRAHPPQHGDLAAQPGRGVSLVRALASGLVEEGAAGNGLARHRDARGAADQVHVQAAHHQDLPSHARLSPSGRRSR